MPKSAEISLNGEITIGFEPSIKQAMIVGSAMEARSELTRIREQAKYHDDGRIKTACDDAIKAFESVVAETVIMKSDA